MNDPQKSDAPHLQPLAGPVLVTGATGKQGGAVVRHCLEAGLTVRALCRDPASPRAQLLGAQGVEVVQGDLGRPATLPAALDGAAGVFSVQNYWEKSVGYAGEVRQGRALAEAAHRAGVRLFVQSTMASADEDKAPLPEHFLSKRRIEAAVDDLGLPRTFLGTVFFMDNFGDTAMGGPLLVPMLTGVLGRSTPLQMLAVDDIGRAAAAVFGAPTRYAGTRLDLVGDVLTVPQLREVHRRATGRRPAGWALPTALSRRLAHEFVAQLQWQVHAGFDTPPPGSDRAFPGLQDLEQHLRARRPQARRTEAAAPERVTA